MCAGKQELAKCRTPFLLGYTVYSGSLVDAEAFQERTLDGGAERPLGIKVSWDSSSEEGGAAHGPLHPALFTSKLLGFDVSLGMFRPQRFLFGSLASGFCFEERNVWFSEPFKLWALFCLVFWLFSGPRLGGGCIVTMTLFSTTRAG